MSPKPFVFKIPIIIPKILEWIHTVQYTHVRPKVLHEPRVHIFNLSFSLTSCILCSNIFLFSG